MRHYIVCVNFPCLLSSSPISMEDLNLYNFNLNRKFITCYSDYDYDVDGAIGQRQQVVPR